MLCGLWFVIVTAPLLGVGLGRGYEGVFCITMYGVGWFVTCMLWI